MADLHNVASSGGLAGAGAFVDSNFKPVTDLTTYEYYGGKPLVFFVVDFKVAANAETGWNEAIQAVINIIQKYSTIVIRGDLFDTNTQMAFAVEQSNDSLNWDGAGAETLVEQIEDEIQALGAGYGENSFAMNNVTCEVKTSFSNFTHS